MLSETKLIFGESKLGTNEMVDKIAFLMLRYQKEKKLGIEAALKIREYLPEEKQSDFVVAHERAKIIDSLKAEADKLKNKFDVSGGKTALLLAQEASTILADGKKYACITKKHTAHFSLSGFVASELGESKKATAKEAMKICWRSFNLTDPYRCDIIEDILRNPYIDTKIKREEIKPILLKSKSETNFMKRLLDIEINVISRITLESDKYLKVMISDMIDECIKESAFNFCISGMIYGDSNEEIYKTIKQFIEVLDQEKRIGCLIELVNSLMNSDKIDLGVLKKWEKTLKLIAVKLISEQLCNRLSILRKEKPLEYTQDVAMFKTLGEILPHIWMECKLLFIENGLKEMKECAIADDAKSLYQKWMSRKMKEEERNTLFQYIVCDAYKDISIKKEEMEWIIETCLKDELPNLVYNFNIFNDIIASNKSSNSPSLVDLLAELEVKYKFRDISDWIATLKTKKDVKKPNENLNFLIVSIYDKCTDLEIERDEPKIKALFKDLSIGWKIYAEYLLFALKLRFLLKHAFGQIKEDNAKIGKFLKEFDKTSINKKPLDRAIFLGILHQIAGSDYEKIKKEFTTIWEQVFGYIAGQDDYETEEVSVNVQGDIVTFELIVLSAENRNDDTGKDLRSGIIKSDGKKEAHFYQPSEDIAEDVLLVTDQGLNFKKKLEANNKEQKDSLNPEKGALKPNQILQSTAKPKNLQEANEYGKHNVADSQYNLYSITVGNKDVTEEKIDSYDSFIEAIKVGRKFFTFENNVFDLERLIASDAEYSKKLTPYVGRDIGNVVFSGGKIKNIPSKAKCGEIVDPLSLSLFTFTPDTKKVEKNEWKVVNYDGLSDFFIKVSLEPSGVKEMLALQLNIKDFGKYVTLRRSTDQKEMNFALLSCMQGDIDENYSKLAQEVLDSTKGEGPLLIKEAASRKKVTFIANAKEEFSKWLLFYADPEIDTLSIKGPFVKMQRNNTSNRVQDCG